MDSTETKIRKGQAMNLAVSWAIQEGKSQDTKEIYKKALYFIDIINIFQEATIEELTEILNEK